MKITVPGSILATSLNIGAMVKAGVPQGAAETSYADETQQSSEALSPSEVISVRDAEDDFYTTVREVPVEIEWDKSAEKRFQALAVKEALETLNGAELAELEQLTIARRKHTTPSVTTEEILEELKQWQRVNCVFEALHRYVQKIGLERATFTNRS